MSFASSMKSNLSVHSYKQPISYLSKGLMIGGVVLTILSVAVFATFFFGHYIPITDVQHFLSKIHQIPNMTWYVTAAGSVLGAPALACMISSVVSNKKNIMTDPTQITECRPRTKKSQENLERLSDLEPYLRRSLVLYALKNIDSEDLKKFEHRFDQKIDTLKLERLIKTDLNNPRRIVKLKLDSEKKFSKVNPTDETFNLLPPIIKLTCCQTFQIDFQTILTDIPSFQKNNLKPALKPGSSASDINDENDLVAQITKTKTGYTVVYFYNMPKIINIASRLATNIDFDRPIKFSVSFDLVEEDSKWKAKNTQIILPKDSEVVTTGNRLESKDKEEV